MSDSLWPHGLQHSRLTCPSPSPGVRSHSWTLSQWCYLSISSSAASFSFPSIRVFSNEFYMWPFTCNNIWILTIISNLKIKIQLYGSPNVLSQLLILLLGGLGSHINFSKFVEEEVMSLREARYLIQGHPFGKCWLKSAISGLRLWILCSF